jgi:CBS domain containing-hemolysin-like protein
LKELATEQALFPSGPKSKIRSSSISFTVTRAAMIEATLLLLLGIVVILVNIAGTAYFVAQEFAYMSVDRTRLAARAAEGDVSAARALSVTKRTSFMLSGAQLGITVTGLLGGFLAEPMVGQPLGVLLGGAGVPTEVGVTIGTLLALIAATLIAMIFGELYPKNLAIADPEPLALHADLPQGVRLADRLLRHFRQSAAARAADRAGA